MINVETVTAFDIQNVPSLEKLNYLPNVSPPPLPRKLCQNYLSSDSSYHHRIGLVQALKNSKTNGSAHFRTLHPHYRLTAPLSRPPHPHRERVRTVLHTERGFAGCRTSRRCWRRHSAARARRCSWAFRPTRRPSRRRYR